MDIETAREAGRRDLRRQMAVRLSRVISGVRYGYANTELVIELLEDIREDAAYRGRISGESGEHWPDPDLQTLDREAETAIGLAKRGRDEELVQTLREIRDLV